MDSRFPIDNADTIANGLGRAVFLDRDGVINRVIIRDGRPSPPRTVDEVVLDDYAAAGLTRLKQAGFRLIVVTNQPDVARGTLSLESVALIHEWISVRLPLDDIRTCCHDDADQCSCRKPLPGLLLDAARDHGVDLAASYMVGDRWRDVEAGRRAGCQTVFIDYDYAEQRPESPDVVVRTFCEACHWILRHSNFKEHQS